MKLIFNDAEALTVQSVTNEGDYLSIKAISVPVVDKSSILKKGVGHESDI